MATGKNWRHYIACLESSNYNTTTATAAATPCEPGSAHLPPKLPGKPLTESETNSPRLSLTCARTKTAVAQSVDSSVTKYSFHLQRISLQLEGPEGGLSPFNAPVPGGIFNPAHLRNRRPPLPLISDRGERVELFMRNINISRYGLI